MLVATKTTNADSVAIQIEVGQIEIRNVITSELFIKTSDTIIGRIACNHIGDGIYELTVRCRNVDNFQCFRSCGLFDGVDSLPQWYYESK